MVYTCMVACSINCDSSHFVVQIIHQEQAGIPIRYPQLKRRITHQLYLNTVVVGFFVAGALIE